MEYPGQDAQEFLRFLIEKLHEVVKILLKNRSQLVEINEQFSDNEKLKNIDRKILVWTTHYVGQLQSAFKLCVVAISDCLYAWTL